MVKFDEKLELTRKIAHLRIEIKMKENLLVLLTNQLKELKSLDKEIVDNIVERCIYAKLDKENSKKIYERSEQLPTGKRKNW